MKTCRVYWILFLMLWSFLGIAAAASDPGKDLIEAARRGQMDKLDALIKQGVDVNSADKDGYTALMRAIFSAKADVVEALIKAGANVNLTNTKGQSAAFLALDNGIGDIRPEIILLLANAGVDFSKEIVRSEPAIIHAANTLNSKTVRALLQAGVDPNTKSKKGKAVIFYAAENANMPEGVEMIAGLVSKKADVNVKDDKGRTALERIANASSSEYFDDASVRENYGAAVYALVRGGADSASIESATKSMVSNGYAYMLEMLQQAQAAGPIGAQPAASTAQQAPAAEPAATPAGSTAQFKFMPVPQLGVQIEAPADAAITELFEGSVNIAASGFSLNLTKSSASMGYDMAVSDAESSTFGAGKIKAFTKKEKRPDGGWALEWTYTMPGQNSDLFGVLYRVIIGGTHFDCKSSRVDSAEGAARVAKSCAGIKKS